MFADFHYFPLDTADQAEKKKVARSVPGKTIQITVEERTSQ